MDLMSIGKVIAVIAIIWYITSTIIIYENLRNRNLNVSFLFLRFLAPKYAHQYKEITIKETGKIGKWFYHWIVSINIALIAVILMIIAKQF